jgi:hypothetical protein
VTDPAAAPDQVTHSVKLTASELLRLDGHCRPEIQGVVDIQKHANAIRGDGLTPKMAAMIAEIVASARKNKRLTYVQTSIRYCPCCGRNDGYYTHSRSGRFHRRGAPNYERPKLFAGVDLARGFISVQNHIGVGFCMTCEPIVRPPLLAALVDVSAELPEQLTGEPPRFKRYANQHCKKCDWRGHEGEMGMLRTLMGDGFYRGKCPSCGAENGFLNTTIETVDGFTLVATSKHAVAMVRERLQRTSKPNDKGDSSA